MAWSFIQLSDIHIGIENKIKFQPSWVENFHTAIQQIKDLDQQPDFLIITGDMTRDGKSKPEELRNVKNIFEGLDWPVYVIPGNHDIGNRYRDDKKNVIKKETLDSYRDIMGDDKFLFSHKGIQFVGFNSFLFGSTLDEEEVQWQWLEAQAKAKDIAQFWFMHSIPFIESPGEVEPIIDTGNWYYTIGTKSTDRLMKVLKMGNIKSLSNGHVHQYLKRTVDNINFTCCPSSAFVTDHNELPGKEFLGFLEWTVEGDSAVSKDHKLIKISELEGVGFNPGVPVSTLK